MNTTTTNTEHFEAAEFCLSLVPTEIPPAMPLPLPLGIDRRVVTRLELCVGVGFLSDTNFYSGFIADISEGGVFIATHMIQPIGSNVTATFALPSGTEITVKGVVCWVRDPNDDDDCTPGMGLRFLDLRAKDVAAIREFIEGRAPRGYAA